MNRKTLLLFLLILVSLTGSFSQEINSVKQIYAYKQASLPGIQPNTLEGRGIQETKTTYNYWFYFIIQRSEKIKVTELWIEGNKFSVRSDTVKKLPVYKITYTAASGNDTLTMVPFTKNTVLLVNPARLAKESKTISNYLSDLTKSHELVITYYRNGKKYYRVVKKIFELEPEARM
jgi:hypothetical protein